jgi:hypothetical protein
MNEERKHLERTLAEWIEKVFADNGRKDKVIYANKNGVRPDPPFIMLQFIGGKRSWSPSRTKVNPETAERKYYVHSEKTITLHGIGSGSFDLLETIMDSIFIGKYKSFLRRKNLVVRKLTDVTEVGEQTDTEIMSRAKFDIRVSFIRVVTYKPGWIEKMRIIPEDIPSLAPWNVNKRNVIKR